MTKEVNWFAIRLKNVRMSKHMTSAQLGEKANLYQGTIRRYERGKLKPRKNTVIALCNALGVAEDSLTDTEQIKLEKAYVTSGFSERMKAARKKNNTSINKIGNMVGLSESGIRRIEKRQSTPTLSAVVSLAALLSVPLDWLLYDEKKGTEQKVRIPTGKAVTESGMALDAEESNSSEDNKYCRSSSKPVNTMMKELVSEINAEYILALPHERAVKLIDGIVNDWMYWVKKAVELRILIEAHERVDKNA